MRQILVVFQFVISIALGVATIVVYSQLQFMRDHDLGFNPEQILVLKRPARVGADISWARRYRSFKNELLKYPTVRGVAGSNIIPGQGFMAGLAISRIAGGTLDDIRSFHDFWTDSDFLKTYGMTFLAGRDFLPENAGGSADSSSIILSESAAKQLGFASAADAVGKEVFLFGSERHTVIGVIKDYHHEQLQKPQNSTMFNISSRAPDFISIKLSARNLRAALASIEAAWKEHFPGNPFDFFFLDDFFNAQYQAYERLEKVFSLFAALALIIASLGILGLVSYAIAQRRKEIGIRKVLGASVAGILSLLSKDFVKLVAVANIIAWPVAYFVMNKWLQDFAYRINIGWWVFALAGGIALLIALLTVSTQAIKAALANPVESLRYE